MGAQKNILYRKGQNCGSFCFRVWGDGDRTYYRQQTTGPSFPTCCSDKPLSCSGPSEFMTSRQDEDGRWEEGQWWGS